MGYYNKFKIKINNSEIPLPIQEDIFNYIMKSGPDHWYLRVMLEEQEERWFSKLLPDTLEIEEVKWYDYKEELTELVKKFPELVLEVERRGEVLEDYEVTIFKVNDSDSKDGKVTIKNIIPYPELLEFIRQYLPTKEQVLDYIKKYY